ncbi:uncharacterized protein LOC131336374 [Rhododendron vialii]|uniref:uncharacterized protein LOC131336374 n=1 Tax=Rhododendron vialii TaxID=182163 RepID=UPI00265DFBB1|nr:uncharacterized protein LOC131336374 [Rhododendron vialii]
MRTFSVSRWISSNGCNRRARHAGKKGGGSGKIQLAGHEVISNGPNKTPNSLTSHSLNNRRRERERRAEKSKKKENRRTKKRIEDERSVNKELERCREELEALLLVEERA